MDTNIFQTDLGAALETTKQKYAEMLTDYHKLALDKELADEDADQLDQIYAEAEQHPMLNFFLTEIDHRLNRKLGLLSNDALECHKNQQAWLRDQLEQAPFDHDHRQEVQRMLAELGFYQGPIDGVLGDRSAQAIKQMNTRIQELLSKRGFYNKSIDGLFGKFSIEAMKNFQKSKSLQNHGVPNRETLLALQPEQQDI
jgi:murein L,D-transpeptidase YcbB/YkuD